MPLPHAVVISATLALLGWRLAALTRAGALAAAGVGTAILAATGGAGMGALAAFFFGATLVSRVAPDPGRERLDTKGTTRDAWQVAANGGAAALGALIAGPLGVVVVTTSLAAAAADTWATGFGGWSRNWPLRIFTLQRVPPGTSGGVTLLGCVGAFFGALSVGLGALLGGGSSALLIPAVTVGMAGMLADSALGAHLQGAFHCDACGQPTERRRHRCGGSTRHVSGLRWLDNDGVNALTTIAAALAGWLWCR